MTESQYQFEPDYQKWWKKKSVAKEDFAWVLLGVEPKEIEKAIEISKKPEYSRSDEERIYMGRLDHFSLSNGHITLGSLATSHRALLKLEWKGKEDFIKIAYEHAHDFPPALREFLASIGKMPNIPDLEKYKNHARYKADLSACALQDLDKLKSEDEALSYLLGLNPVFWAAFQSLDEKQKKAAMKDQRTGAFDAYISFTPEEKWLFKHYPQFLKGDFPLFSGGRLAFCQLSTRLRDAGCLAEWKDDFAAYVQALHDNGVLFRPETYAALERHEIPLIYTENGWAIQFYRGFQRREPTWELKTAASLYLGQHPTGHDRGFIVLGGSTGLHSTGHGLALDSNETIAEYDSQGRYIEPTGTDIEDVFSDEPGGGAWYLLEKFVRGHIQKGTLKPVTDGDKHRFIPAEIVAFFRKELALTFQPKALFIALRLGIESNSEEKPMVSSVDAFQETYWNLTQVFAWTHLKDPAYVNKASSENASYGTYKEEMALPSGRRMVEQFSPAPNHLRVAILGVLNGVRKPFEQSKKELLEKLRAGKIRCWGLENNIGKRIEIPKEAWIDLNFFTDGADRESYAAPKDHSVKYHKLRFLREEIEKIEIADGGKNQGIEENPALAPVLVKVQPAMMIESTTMIKNAAESPVQKDAGKQQGKRQKEIHVCIGGVVRDLKNTRKSGYKPTGAEVWTGFKEQRENFECVQSIEHDEEKNEEAIYWKSARGVEQRMLKSTFIVLVSEFNSGKKSLPE